MLIFEFYINFCVTNCTLIYHYQMLALIYSCPDIIIT